MKPVKSLDAIFGKQESRSRRVFSFPTVWIDSPLESHCDGR